jgi:hypothetical protein
MPVHDWTHVDAGIFHALRHGWIEELARALNRGLLPRDYYTLPEQHAAGFGPDVLSLQGTRDEEDAEGDRSTSASGTPLLHSPPRMKWTAETDRAFYCRKQMSVGVRHISGDRVVAMIEVVSPGNKSTRRALQAFVNKAAELLDQQVHLLVLDLIPPGRYDPQGIHAAIWEAIAGQEYALPADHLLTLASYEADLAVRAYVQKLAVGESLPDMPLFLEPNACVQVPLDATYQSAFQAMPARWKRVLSSAT